MSSDSEYVDAVLPHSNLNLTRIGTPYMDKSAKQKRLYSDLSPSEELHVRSRQKMDALKDNPQVLNQSDGAIGGNIIEPGKPAIMADICYQELV